MNLMRVNVTYRWEGLRTGAKGRKLNQKSKRGTFYGSKFALNLEVLLAQFCAPRERKGKNFDLVTSFLVG